MSLKDAILEIPELVKQLKEKFNTVKFADVKLADGTILRYEGDMPAIGMKVDVIAADGTIAPVVDGEYPLEDGSIIVTIGGMISEMKPAAEEKVAEGELANAPATPTQQAKEQSVKRMIESIVKESVFTSVKDFSDLKEEFEKTIKESTEKIESVKTENESLKKDLEKQNELLKETFALVEKIAGLPSEPTKIIKKDGFKQSKELVGFDKMMNDAKELSKKVFK